MFDDNPDTSSIVPIDLWLSDCTHVRTFLSLLLDGSRHTLVH